MKGVLAISFYFLSLALCYAQATRLKSIVYDFDGLDIDQTELPDGDYSNFDLTHKVAINPVAGGDALGDRVLELNLNWAEGSGEFGKGVTRYIELNSASDYFNFYFYNPVSNYAGAEVDVTIKEDDDVNNLYETAFDDKWTKSLTIPQSPGWQLIALPLNTFIDMNTGGNDIFDAGYTGNGGKVLIVSLTFRQSLIAIGPEKYYIDMLCFSQGPLPTGDNITDLPPADNDDYCLLGCYAYRTPADSVPPEVESMFSPVNKLQYINIFMPFAHNGTVASVIPGTSVQRLLDNGYTPIITWEMMYTDYAPLDPVQPRLNQITTGLFDSYLDAFADRVQLYTDTVYIRLFHEFDGDWYPWAVALNNQDPAELIAAFRYVVERFRARGTGNVKWIWSPNSSPSPSAGYNWLVSAYPGDSYVDIVGISVYNHPLPGIPPWRSFRSVLAESYYYLTTYFPDKPFFICESACRERYNTEPLTSQTKAEWICQMDKDMQSYFSKARALVFLSVVKEHDWRINSSVAAQEALRNCVWEDEYYSAEQINVSNPETSVSCKIYPNPFSDEITIAVAALLGSTPYYRVRVYYITGREAGSYAFNEKITFGNALSPGAYILELSTKGYSERMKIIKN